MEQRITMKKLFLINFLIFLYSFTWGQSAPLVLSTKVTINSVTVFTDPYTVTGTTNDVTSNWTASDIAAGDSLYLEDGSELRVYQVVSISSAVGTAFTIVINDLNNTGSLPTTGVGALYRGTTNYDFPVWTAGISETLQSMIDNRFKQRLDSQLFNAGMDYITTDSFSTFISSNFQSVSFSSIPVGSTIWRTTTGNRYQKTSSTAMTLRSSINGANASTILGVTGNTMSFSARLNAHVRLNTTGNPTTATINAPLYNSASSVTVGSEYLIGITAGTNDVTITWNTIYGLYDKDSGFSNLGTTFVPAQSTVEYKFRIVVGAAETIRLQLTDNVATSWDKNITTGTLAAATATRTIPMGGQDLIIDNADDIRLKATGEYYIGSGGGDAPSIDSDNSGFDLGYGSSNELVLHQRAADQVLSKAGAPVDGTDVAWYVGQLLVNTSTGDIYRASSKSTNPDFAGTGSVWVQVGGTGGSVSDSPVRDTITKNSHGFLVGQPVTFVGGILVGSQATTPIIAQAVVTKIISANVVEIGYRGSFTATSHGFTVDSSYYTPNAAGAAVINASKPTKAQFLFRVKDANTLIVSVGDMFDSAGSGGSGSVGTANYLSKWLTPSTQGSSLLYENAGKIMFNTTTPVGTSDITINTTSGNGINMYSTSSAGGPFLMFNSSSPSNIARYNGMVHQLNSVSIAGWGLRAGARGLKMMNYMTTGSNMSFDSLGIGLGGTIGEGLDYTNYAMVIPHATKYVGIGATAPQTNLEVVSSSNVAPMIVRNPTANSYTSYRLYNDQNSGARSLQMAYGGSTYSSALMTNGPIGESGYISTGGFPLVLGTNFTARMVFAPTTGYIGIGTASPTSKLDITHNGIGILQNSIYGLSFVNNSLAGLNAQQQSPPVRWRGSGWKTDATAGSQTVDFMADVLPVQGTAAPSGNWQLKSSINGATYNTILSANSAGNLTVSSNSGVTTTETLATLNRPTAPTIGNETKLAFALAGTDVGVMSSKRESSSAYSMNFFTTTGGLLNTTPAIHLTQNNMVGINKDTASYNLDIKINSGLQFGARIEGSSTAAGMVFQNTTTGTTAADGLSIMTVGNDAAITNAENGDLTLQANTTALIVRKDGFVAFPTKTAAAITALGSVLDGAVVYVTSTDATFTSVGFWGRENGAWVKL